jgi:hypothetical protein
MISKIVGAAFLITLGGLGGYVLASNPQILPYLHQQQPETSNLTARPTETRPRIDPETRYRLQERCAERAKLFFEQEYAWLTHEMNQRSKPGDGTYLDVYESHFNVQHNACLIFRMLRHLKTGQEAITEMMMVDDVTTRHSYALYTKNSMCDVNGVPCQSELEWFALAKPYIEELASP